MGNTTSRPALLTGDSMFTISCGVAGVLAFCDTLGSVLIPFAVWITCVATSAASWYMANRIHKTDKGLCLICSVGGTVCTYNLWRRFLLDDYGSSVWSSVVLITALIGAALVIVSWVILATETNFKAVAGVFVLCMGVLALLTFAKFGIPTEAPKIDTSKSTGYAVNPADTSEFEYKLTLWHQNEKVVFCFNPSDISVGVATKNSNSYVLYFNNGNGSVRLLDGVCVVRDGKDLLYHSSNYLLEKLEIQ